MQKIREWMEANPDGAKELRRQNRSYVFFREVQLSDKDEAVGAQGVPLTPGRSIAVDKSLHVYGTPFFIDGELPIESERSKTPFRRLMIAQDTGSAIVGPARADLYFGAGAEAGKVAGRLRNNMRVSSCWCRRASIRSARGRKLPVPDERPSAKIAKLFPQTDPLKDVRQNGAEATRRLRRHDGTDGSDSARPQRAVRACLAGAPRCKRCRCRKRGPTSRRSGEAASAAPPPLSLSDETPVVESRSRNCRPPRRKRGLSEEERALWESVAKQVKPLRKRHRPKPQAMRRRRNRAPRRNRPRRRSRAPTHIGPATSREPPPLAPLGRRERSQLSRGRKEIDARLDLHGMTQTRAHRALFGFLQRAHHDGLTFVLVITGKGKVGAAKPSAACCAVRCRNG